MFPALDVTIRNSDWFGCFNDREKIKHVFQKTNLLKKSMDIVRHIWEFLGSRVPIHLSNLYFARFRFFLIFFSTLFVVVFLLYYIRQGNKFKFYF